MIVISWRIVVNLVDIIGHIRTYIYINIMYKYKYKYICIYIYCNYIVYYICGHVFIRLSFHCV